MMTLERAITLASSADNGELNDLWREVVAVLVAEVKMKQAHLLDAFIAKFVHEPFNDDCRCPACQIAEETNEPQGPLPAPILADQADQIADALADFAMEVDIFNGLKYEVMVALSKHVSANMVQFAKELRGEV